MSCLLDVATQKCYIILLGDVTACSHTVPLMAHHKNESYVNKSTTHLSVVRSKSKFRAESQTKEKETILTRWGAGLDLGGGRVNVRVLVAPGSVPSRQPQRLEAQAQVCDTRRHPGWCHLLGARHATVGEEHPPAAHCSQLRLFWVRDPVQRNRNRTVKRAVKSVPHRNRQSTHYWGRIYNPSLMSRPTLPDGKLTCCLCARWNSHASPSTSLTYLAACDMAADASTHPC